MTTPGGEPAATAAAQRHTCRFVSGVSGARAMRVLDRRLKVASIALPVVFVVALELLRFRLERSSGWTGELLHVWRVSFVVGVVALVVGFALVMSRLIDHAQRRVLRQNRDLVAVTALATAVQGRTEVSAIVEAALDSLLATSGAVRVGIHLYGGDEEPATHRRRELPGAETGGLGPAVEMPLSHGRSSVGRLELCYAEGAEPGDRLGPAALSSLGTQIACAVQLAQAVQDLGRRKTEGHAFYDVLLKVSGQTATVPVLTAVAEHARTLLDASAAAVIVGEETARTVAFGSGPDAPLVCADGTTVIGVGLPDPRRTPTSAHPLRADAWRPVATAEIRGVSGVLGTLWVARTTGEPFTPRDHGFLSTLAGLAGIALTSAQMRESSRQRAILNERTRIAREMHDSLAQVLGAVHLRLRALETADPVRGSRAVATEVGALAEVCADAYQDVREVILGLRDSHRTERGLEENLHAYVSRFGRQAALETVLVNEVGREISLSPRAEVHLIRVVQEALTNVRKHAGASLATVTISGTATSTTFTIEDDGAGFDARAASEAHEGYGLFTMRDRLAILGGTLEVDSAPGRGTRIVATVPERPYPLQAA